MSVCCAMLSLLRGNFYHEQHPEAACGHGNGQRLEQERAERKRKAAKREAAEKEKKRQERKAATEPMTPAEAGVAQWRQDIEAQALANQQMEQEREAEKRPESQAAKIVRVHEQERDRLVTRRRKKYRTADKVIIGETERKAADSAQNSAGATIKWSGREMIQAHPVTDFLLGRQECRVYSPYTHSNTISVNYQS